MHPGNKVHGLLGDIGVPDKHVLTEPDVHPEATEANQQFAEIVQVVVAEKSIQRPLSPQQDAGDDDGGGAVDADVGDGVGGDGDDGAGDCGGSVGDPWGPSGGSQRGR